MKRFLSFAAKKTSVLRLDLYCDFWSMFDG